jgi:hypothetical protein
MAKQYRLRNRTVSQLVTLRLAVDCEFPLSDFGLIGRKSASEIQVDYATEAAICGVVSFLISFVLLS